MASRIPLGGNARPLPLSRGPFVPSPSSLTRSRSGSRPGGREIAYGTVRGYATPRRKSSSRTLGAGDAAEAGDADRRLRDLLGREIKDDFAKLRERYDFPKHPIVLAHGLLGFSELRLLGEFLPAVQYWRGIKEALIATHSAHAQPDPDPADSTSRPPPDSSAPLVSSSASSSPPLLSSSPPPSAPSSSSSPIVSQTPPPAPDEKPVPRVITTSVPPSSSIEDRARYLAQDILAQLGGPTTPITVNIVAHSMGGLDARFLISRLRVPNLRVASLVTVATPHHGSAVADYFIDGAGASVLSPVYPALRRVGLGTEAFSQLTTGFICDTFNQETPDADGVRYFSYGASIGAQPGLLNPFRGLWLLLAQKEGPNDGLVSVPSARWGEYKGTLVGVTHLDLINWSNRFGWTLREWLGARRT